MTRPTASPARAPEAWTNAPAACPVATRAEPMTVAAGSVSVMTRREARSPAVPAVGFVPGERRSQP